ncbi:YHS domain-containing protein [Microbacterium sp. NPDC077391]|uniref:YHS domain-containing protein n=1 Tax=unclassified Microbacterium TaxID=2609290 RepID=UPI000E99B288|nr:hypothetical protein [Microbacterium sp.]HBS75043.1 hypothetical protein [Microbacterium sp.]HBU41890.1 hypothetical protein [Microbacterium sp.]HCM51487.1 hypothetical protein [Microbacterium sp.]|tara:strand:- start:2782 stop:3072 length:291 start_codon:yes stop_codon:yes gene_type:complete
MNDTPAATSCCSTTASKAATETPENLLAGSSCCGGAAAADEDMTTCPVMVGSPVSKKKAIEAGLFRDYEGERYYFCCPGCDQKFDVDPAKYAANMV